MTEPGTRELDQAAFPGSSVHCPLKGGAQIAPGRCVEYQRDNGCHCENALVALGHVEKHLQRHGLGPVDPEDEEKRESQLAVVHELTARAKEIERTRPAPTPAPTPKEEVMPHATAKCAWKESPCDGQIRVGANKSGLCGRHSNILRMREKSAEKRNGKPARNGATRAPTPPKAPPHAPAPAVAGDVVQLLEAQLAHHQAQAQRIERALSVLREIA